MAGVHLLQDFGIVQDGGQLLRILADFVFRQPQLGEFRHMAHFVGCQMHGHDPHLNKNVVAVRPRRCLQSMNKQKTPWCVPTALATLAAITGTRG
jgi:hypothetical protein